MKDTDIIIIGLQPWYTDIGSNCKNIATELARTNRVLYVNIPLNRNTLRNEKGEPHIHYHYQVTRGEVDPIEKINDSFWHFYPGRIHESINWIPNTRIFSYFNYLNNKRLAKDIQEAADRLGFDNYILFNDNDIFRGYWLKELLNPELYVYYCRDFLTASGYFKRHGAALEPLHIAKADLTFSNSVYLTEYLAKYNPNSYFVGQGCNISLFNAEHQYLFPADIRETGKPIIAYIGNLTTMRLDIDILVSIAEGNPKWDLLLVGPEDEIFKKSKLHQLPNVLFTGKKELKDIPRYMQVADVCINPQLINPLTIGNYPLKIDEYLAMGKPVVATKTDAMEMFSEYCYLAEKKEDYAPLISKALAENDSKLRSERTLFASQHNWENSTNAIRTCIENYLADRSSRQSTELYSEIIPAS